MAVNWKDGSGVLRISNGQSPGSFCPWTSLVPNGLIAVVCLLGLLARSAEPPGGKELGIIEDFERVQPGLFQKGFIDSWRWSGELREQASGLSQLEVVREDDTPCLRVSIGKDLPFKRGYHSILRLDPYYPPEGDAIRMRIKMVSGKGLFFLGGPTAYYGNSDVFTAVHELNAEPEPEWVEVEFSLNHPLWRNFRRAGFSTEAPRNYYNRWAQESLSVYIADGTEGEFLIDRVELIGRGEGRPFPVFSADKVETVRAIADFEAGNSDHVFNLYMADGESEWFEQSWIREKPLRFTPAAVSVEEAAEGDGKELVCVGPVAEEVHCTGIKTEGATEANAIRITVERTSANRNNTVIGMGPAELIDFLIFASPSGKPFPWEVLAPSPELLSQPHRGFDYQFSYREIRGRQDLDVGVYQTRRYLKPEEASTFILPLADFTCIYGNGAFRQHYLEHRPLTSEDIIAVAWLNPWNRVGDRRMAITTRVDDVAFVKVSGTPENLRSFWQISNPSEVKMEKVGNGSQAIQYMLLRGEEIP